MKILPFTFLFLFLVASCSQGDQNDTILSKNEIAQSDKVQLTSTQNKDVPVAFKKAHKVVDQMPLFGGCATKECSDEKLIKYIQNNIKYPKEAKEGAVEGRVFVQFIIETDGSVTNTHLVRDLGSGTGSEAVRVVELMNDLDTKWTAGIEDGKKVPVMFTLPVSYKLE